MRNYIEANLEKDLSACEAGRGGGAECHLFVPAVKNVTGVNIYEYVLDCRMRKAKELLLKSSEKIQDIGIRVGYDSAQSFTRVFRKHTGQTPTDYREKEKNC